MSTYTQSFRERPCVALFWARRNQVRVDQVASHIPIRRIKQVRNQWLFACR
jgi:hypothetical protein